MSPQAAPGETEGLTVEVKPPDDAVEPRRKQPLCCCKMSRRMCCAAVAVWLCGVVFGGVVVGLVLRVLRDSLSDLPPPCSTGCTNFSHALWTDVLQVRLRPSSRAGVEYVGFDYEGLRQDQTVFRQYLQQLEDADLAMLGVTERKALFINAYNALAVRVLVDECGGQLCGSIRDLSSFAFSVWDQPAGHIGGSTGNMYSLDNIEHDTLRNGEYFTPDARIHAAVNCASVSCPDLHPEAFEAYKLNEQLDDAMRSWLANPTKGLAADEHANTLTLSKIFTWYSDDFEAEPGGMLAFVSRHAPSEVAGWLRTPAVPALSYFDYDWSVNIAT